MHMITHAMFETRSHNEQLRQNEKYKLGNTYERNGLLRQGLLVNPKLKKPPIVESCHISAFHIPNCAFISVDENVCVYVVEWRGAYTN